MNIENIDKKYLVFASIFMVANRLQVVMDSCKNEITAKQWFTMLMLQMFPQPPTLMQLAKMCDTSHQNTKQIVLKLQEKGFVHLEKDAEDRRVVRIYQTGKMDEWNTQNHEFSEKFITDMFSTLSKKETEEMFTSQQKIYQMLEQMKGNLQ